MGKKSRNTKSREFIALNKSEVYRLTTTLTQACMQHYYPLLSKYEYYALIKPFFRLNNLIAQACTVINQGTYTSYINLAHITLKQIKEGLISPSSEILEKIKTLEIIFVKIQKKKGENNNEHITI